MPKRDSTSTPPGARHSLGVAVDTRRTKPGEVRLEVAYAGTLLTPAVLSVLYDIIDAAHPVKTEANNDDRQAG